MSLASENTGAAEAPFSRTGPTGSIGAEQVYGARTAELREIEARLQREHVQLGYLRLALGVAVIALLLPPRVYAFLPIAGFALATRVHERILARLAGTRRSLGFYEKTLARIADRWSGLNPRKPRVDVSGSLYAADLDLFGTGSLFELLCEARTSLGEDTLANWLLMPAGITDALQRQIAVEELGAGSSLREAFAASPGPAIAVLDADAIAQWSEAAAESLRSWLTWIAPLLVVLTLLAGWRYAAAHSPLLLLLMLAVNSGLTFSLGRTYKPLFSGLESVRRALATAAVLLRHIEAANFSAPRLQQLQSSLLVGDQSASQALQQLATLAEWTDARGNYLVRILDVPFLYSLQLGMRVQRWRMRHGAQLRQWLQILGEFEALLSLSALRFEHPDDVFPTFLGEGPPVFQAVGLGHPLLPSLTCVRNDVALGTEPSLLLVSGSNMSGKSTLLRSVGINAVLAFAGAPVRARKLRLSPLTVAASIQVHDSLQAGQSRFYAEILRLRAISLAARKHPPLLFLLDELLAGTNSSDRLAGAEGLLRELLAAGAMGMLSTHDLALTTLASTHGGKIRNMHFEDRVIDGRIEFDYKLRDGVVQRSNGIALMRMIGLDV
ncbi:MAG TPA: hypothetical protein VKV02_12015 [Acidobacteriaceae bacterium]|nr:hypothetical protein [Acidobacteriaceae bacterium]